MRSGQLGRVTAARGFCYKRRDSIGRADDKTTWRIDFKDEATSEQRAAAAATVAAFVWSDTAVPQAVTMRQARLALHAAGKLAAVDAAIQQSGTAAQIEWEYAQELRRDHPLVAALTPALGMTEAELDALFAQAAAL